MTGRSSGLPVRTVIMVASTGVGPYDERVESVNREGTMDLQGFIRDVPDFPKPGILFKDITPLLSHPQAFRHSIDLMAIHFRGKDIDAIAAAEARGFLFAAPL